MNRINVIFSIVIILISSTHAVSQSKYNAFNLKLTENANAVVRESHTEVLIKSIDKISYKEKRIVTILNERGQGHESALVYYDDAKKVDHIEAIVYNALGEEIKKYKKRDFKDVSVADGYSIFSDNRVLYLNYTPSKYPYTIEFNLETTNKNTAFIPKWFPVEGYYVSTQLSTYKLINETDTQVAFKANNLEGFEIKQLSEFNYEATNIAAIKKEAFSPQFVNFAPSVKFALKNFSMIGVDGENNDWESFGKWMSDKLLADTRELPEQVKTEIVNLTSKVDSPIEKAKIVYKYMQDRTRYISIQVGIGGWKPMLAGDVNRLGYGDCKGLTNYTQALLKAVGVPSYYTIVYGGSDIKNLDKDFSSLEGNHAILSIPMEDDYIWLECTSQDAPFGYNASFTDDRDVLVVMPEGGKIIHTKAYPALNNSQITQAEITIDNTGNISANLNVVHKGTQYSKNKEVQFMNSKSQVLFYKTIYESINNLEVITLNVEDDKDEIQFTEDLTLNANKYASKTANLLLFAPNVFNKRSQISPRYSDRKLDFELDRGYYEEDNYIIEIPQDFELEAMARPVKIINKFGEYSAEIKVLEPNKLSYKRTLLINKGKYPIEDYESFRDFYNTIVKSDNQRIAIKNKN
jgi:transglutaminase-like putative cysteine protease